MKREQIQNKITYSNEFLKVILDSVTDSISIIDVKNYGIVGTNMAFLKQYKLTDKDAIGRKCYELTHHRFTPCVAPLDICPLETMVANGERAMSEHVHSDENGNKMFVEVCAYPILDDKGKVIQAVHLCRDITERKRMEEQLQQTIRELEALNTIFRKHLAVRSETELSYVSLSMTINQLSQEIDGLLTQMQLQDIYNQHKSIEVIKGVASELRRLSDETKVLASKMQLPPAERL